MWDEAETGVTGSWVREDRSPLEAEGSKEHILLRVFRRNQFYPYLDFSPTRLISDFWPLELGVNSCCYKPLLFFFFDILLQQQQESNTEGRKLRSGNSSPPFQPQLPSWVVSMCWACPLPFLQICLLKFWHLPPCFPSGHGGSMLASFPLHRPPSPWRLWHRPLGTGACEAGRVSYDRGLQKDFSGPTCHPTALTRGTFSVTSVKAHELSK